MTEGVGCRNEAGETERIVVASAVVPLYVTYGVSPERLIEQGKYDWQTAYACWPHVRIGGAGVVAYEACRFSFSGPRIREDEARTLIGAHDCKRPWRPAHTAGVLTFGVEYPTEQLIHPVVGLDAWIQLPAGEFNLYLHKKETMHPTHRISLPKRALYLQDRNLDWFYGTQFLALRRKC